MFKDIRPLLSKSIKRAGIDKHVQATKIIKLFQSEVRRILKPDLACKIKPLYIKNNIITVVSLSSLAFQELESKEKQILKEINRIRGREAIKEIRYLT